jgi:Spy/CpxP family protein refolding chaperone
MMRRIGTMILAAGLAALLASPAFAQGRRQPGQGFGGGFGQSGLALLANKSVKEELKITEDQTKKIDDANKELRTKFQDKIREAGMDREKMQAIFKERTAEGEKLAAGILTSEQGKRFKQLELQIQGFRALTNEDVQKQLKFTDEQKKAVEDLGKEVAKETQELFQGAGRDREKMAEARTKIQALGKKAMDTAAKSLTDEQKKTWSTMIGAKFDYKPEAPGPRRDI